MKPHVKKTVASAASLLGLLLLITLFCMTRNGLRWGLGPQIAPYRHPVFASMSDPSREIATYEAQLRARPDRPFVMTSLAGLYAKQGKLSGDSALLDRADALARKSHQALRFFNDGALLVQADTAQARHRFGRAVAICKYLLASNTSRKGAKIDALGILVTSLLAQGKLEAADDYANQLVVLRPAGGSYVLRALVMNAQGRDRDTLRDFELAFQKEAFGDPEEAAFLRSVWGRFYLKHGKLPEARSLLHEALRIAPHAPLALGLLAEVELREGRFGDAETHFAEAFDFSHQAIYLVGEARAKRLRGQEREASELRDEVIRLTEREIRASGYGHRYELARLLLERDRPGDSARALELSEVEARLRASSEILEIHAWALFRNHRPDEARVEIERALSSGVRDAEIYERASAIARALGDSVLDSYYSKRSFEIDPTFRDFSG